MAQLHGYFPTTSSFVCLFDDALVAVARAPGAEKKGLGFLRRFGGERAVDEETESKIEESAHLTSTEFAESLGQPGNAHGLGRVTLDEIEGIEIGPPSPSLERCDFHMLMMNGRKWSDHMEEEDRNRAAILLSRVVGDRLTNRWDQ
jgi:hypothetical protein